MEWSLPRHFSSLLLLIMQAVSQPQPKKLAPLRTQVDRSDDSKDGERTPKKSKKFLKSILSRRKSRKEEPLPSYFDDYWATGFFFSSPSVGRHRARSLRTPTSVCFTFIQVLCSQYKYRLRIENSLKFTWMQWEVSARCHHPTCLFL